ncbi:hypothetical protein ACWN8V_12400 [Vagococcus elongatus]|uniref:Uncharacterized protein n=1 Tax=Vagococcus elongatus TaxID=180344 RepID=A0A430ALR5_9ENTE|nr:hypothetical protein [Vagococcus elongatus]RSU09062.1 hypothetical protein CBF29_12270 [Vagococcus elongatus]
MKKTNFLVIFWLLLAIISFIVFLVNFYSFWYAISYLIFPDKEGYMDAQTTARNLMTAVPMLLVTAGTFYLGLKQGLKVYKEI